MKSIGIIGVGFVGGAVQQGMVHAFDVYCYDKENGCSYHKKGGDTVVKSTPKEEYEDEFDWILKNTDGPIFVCVPTPMNLEGGCHTEIVRNVIESLDKKTSKKRVVVVKSTVVPGTTDSINETTDNLHVCFNPEFLTERASVEDFKSQTRIIVGGPRQATSVVKAMYQVAYPKVPVTKTSSKIAELVKYLTNSFLAVKVSFANEIKLLCDELDVDYDKVIEYAVGDDRLGTSHWAVPGPDGKLGFGGSCFPKDLNALLNLAYQLRIKCNTMHGAWVTNLSIRPEEDWNELEGRAVLKKGKTRR